MNEQMKSRLVIILAVLTAIFFIGTVASCSRAYQQKIARDNEMAVRLEMEERLNSILREKQGLETQLAQQKEALEKTQAALEGALSNNKNLDIELQGAIKLKETLEEGLKEVLVPEKK